MCRSRSFLAFVGATVVLACLHRVSVASEPPYLVSPVIAGLTWDDEVIVCGRSGSGDNWPITWVEDDSCITAWGDGPGFDGPASRDARLSLGFARIHGNPAEVRGEDFATNVDTPEGSGSSGIKASGLLMVDGGPGLARRYPGDKGIENDPVVVFAEDFEEGSLDAVWSRWESVQNREIMSLSPDVPPAGTGEHSLLMAHVGGKSTGAHLYRRLPPGYDRLYVRFYVKFDPNCLPIHHFVHVGGYNPPTPWPQGGAGIRPEGNERFTTGVEPYGKHWRWDFYSYWMAMRSSPDGQSWGHDFINDPALSAERGRWICVELMMKMNEPVTQSNGEQALWIDGRPRIRDGQTVSHLGQGFPRGKWVWDSFHPDPQGEPFEGLRWRTTEDLKLNFLWLLLYITQSGPGHISKVWFDDIVVARQYIGPINAADSH